MYVTAAGLTHSRAWVPPSIQIALFFGLPFDMLSSENQQQKGAKIHNLGVVE